MQNSVGLIDWIEILPGEVFNDRCCEGVYVTQLADNHRNFGELQLLRGEQTPLSRNEFNIDDRFAVPAEDAVYPFPECSRRAS